MITESEKERIVSMYNSGNYTRTKIADEVGVSYYTVRKIISEYIVENTSVGIITDREETENSDMGKHFTAKKHKHNTKNKNSRKNSLNNHQKNRILETTEKEQIETATITMNAEPIQETFVNDISEPESPDIFGFTTEGLELLNRPDNVVEVGLVSNRHDMYIKNYIFDKGISEDLIFDFDKQYEKCEKYIEEHITNHETLVVYCTGLQSALGAITRACYKHKVNLVLKHYNSQNRTYMPQVIYDEFGSIADTSFPFDSIMNNSKKVLCYKSSLSELIKHDTFYCISFNEHGPDNRFKEKSCHYIMTDSIEKAWEIYPKLVALSKDDNNKNKRLSIFINSCNINPSSGFDWGDNWAKSYNYYP